MHEGTEGCLAAVHSLLGVGVFAFLKVPRSWGLIRSVEPPECHALGKDIGESFRWVVSGSMRALLLDEETKVAHTLFVEAREFKDESRVWKFVDKRFGKLRGERGDPMEMRSLQVGDHRARCALWVRRRRGFLGRRERIEALLEWTVYCDLTGRLLWFRVLSGNVEGFMRSKAQVLSMLSSIKCHH